MQRPLNLWRPQNRIIQCSAPVFSVAQTVRASLFSDSGVTVVRHLQWTEQLTRSVCCNLFVSAPGRWNVGQCTAAAVLLGRGRGGHPRSRHSPAHLEVYACLDADSVVTLCPKPNPDTNRIQGQRGGQFIVPASEWTSLHKAGV